MLPKCFGSVLRGSLSLQSLWVSHLFVFTFALCFCVSGVMFPHKRCHIARRACYPALLVCTFLCFCRHFPLSVSRALACATCSQTSRSVTMAMCSGWDMWPPLTLSPRVASVALKVVGHRPYSSFLITFLPPLSSFLFTFALPCMTHRFFALPVVVHYLVGACDVLLLYSLSQGPKLTSASWPQP